MLAEILSDTLVEMLVDDGTLVEDGKLVTFLWVGVLLAFEWVHVCLYANGAWLFSNIEVFSHLEILLKDIVQMELTVLY